MSPLRFLTVTFLITSFLLSGCLTLRSQRKETLLDQVNQLSLQVHTLEQENQILQQRNLENDRIIAQLEDEIADLKVKQDAQAKLLLDQLAKAKAASEIKLTNRNVQRALQAAGYDVGTIDGKIGARTRQAIMAFQKANSLNPDGIVGGETWNRLRIHLAETKEE